MRERMGHGGSRRDTPSDGIPTVQLGRELERRLGVAEGDVLRLVAVDLEDLSFRYRKVRNGKSFETGFAEADSGWVMIDRALVEEMGGKSSLLEIGVADPLETAAITEGIQDILGDEFLVTDWRQFNRELFTALRLQKVALFLVLGLIVVVATFNVASTLVVLARERRREVGVLKALGLRSALADRGVPALRAGAGRGRRRARRRRGLVGVLGAHHLRADQVRPGGGRDLLHQLGAVPRRDRRRAGDPRLRPGGDAGRLLDPGVAWRRPQSERSAPLRLSAAVAGRTRVDAGRVFRFRHPRGPFTAARHGLLRIAPADDC